MKPLAAVLPDVASEEVFGFTIGKGDVVPPGDYALFELYCDEKRCDCRRVLLYVCSKRGKKPAATISFGFDPDGPDPGPYLDPFAGPNGPHAEGFLAIFTDLVNRSPGIVQGLQRHYVLFRERVTRKKYRGRPFPRPGAFVRKAGDSWGQDGLDDLRLLVAQADLALDKDGPARADLLLSGLARAVGERPEDYVSLLAADYAEPDAPGRQAAFILLERALTELRYGIERGRDDDRRRADAFQAAVVEKVMQPGVPAPLKAEVLNALQESKLEPTSALKESYLAAAEPLKEFLIRRGPPDLSPMLEEAREAGLDSPFDLFDLFLAQLRLMEPEVQVAAIAGLAEDRHPLAREVAALMVLHPDAAVRGPVAAVLAEQARPETFSPESLRRLVICRNWVPEEERSGVDAVIREARSRKVECAPVTLNDTVECFASTFDGAGAQALWFTAKEGRGAAVSGVVVRQAYGVRDVFCHRGLSRSQAKGLLRDMQRSVLARPAGLAYVEKAVCHFLQVGLGCGAVAPPQLLQLAELLGGSRWVAKPLDAAEELARLEAEAGVLGAEEVARVLAISAAWPEAEGFAGSWFEDDAAVEEALRGIHRRGRAKAREAVLSRVLEPRREAWAERLLWMALWAREGRPLKEAPWQSFFVLAREILRGRPLAQLPLMASVADLSVEVSRSAR